MHFKKESGFGIIEILVVLVIFILVIAGSFLIFKHHQKQDTSVTGSNCGSFTVAIGSVNNNDVSLRTSDYNRMNSCFYSAYKSHSSASISVTFMGVDTGATNIYKTDGAKITDTIESYSANFGGSQTSKTYSCNQLTQDSSGIKLRCDGSTLEFSPSKSM